MHKFNAPQTGKTQLARKKRKGEKKRVGLRLNVTENLKAERLAVSGKRTGKSKRKRLRETKKILKELEQKSKEDMEMVSVEKGSARRRKANKKNKYSQMSDDVASSCATKNPLKASSGEMNDDMELE